MSGGPGHFNIKRKFCKNTHLAHIDHLDGSEPPLPSQHQPYVVSITEKPVRVALHRKEASNLPDDVKAKLFPVSPDIQPVHTHSRHNSQDSFVDPLSAKTETLSVSASSLHSTCHGKNPTCFTNYQHPPRSLLDMYRQRHGRRWLLVDALIVLTILSFLICSIALGIKAAQK